MLNVIFDLHTGDHKIQAEQNIKYQFEYASLKTKYIYSGFCPRVGKTKTGSGS